MKLKIFTFTTALSLLVGLAVPVQLAAQDKQDDHHKHHHYKLIDLGSTFGGPRSYFNPGSGNDLSQFASVLNSGGTVAGFAETSVPDPFPNFVFWNGVVTHAFGASSGGDLTDLGALPGGGSSAPLWISANGLIAGLSENGQTDPLYAGLPELRAVLWQHDRIEDLGTLEGGYESEANAVNSSGQVVGASLNTIPDTNSMQAGTFWLWGAPPGGSGITPPYQYQTRAFLWEKKNGMQDLGTLPGGTDAQAILINERGQVVGYSYTSSTPSPACLAGFLTTGSFIWDKKNGMVDLGGLGGTCTLAFDLNNRGQAIGVSNLTGDLSQHAFLWEHGSLQDLGGSLGGDFTGAFATNNEGQAVGYAYLSGNATYHAALWRHVGKMSDLGTLGNDPCSYATGINTDGQVVGVSQSSCDANVAIFRAFLSENGSIVDLNDLIPPGSGLHLGQTYTINDRGEIAGAGADSSDNDHAFLLIPCDENHPGLEDCNYDPVEALTEALVLPAQVTPAPAVSPAKLSPVQMMTRIQTLKAGRNRRYGMPQTSPQ